MATPSTVSRTEPPGPRRWAAPRPAPYAGQVKRPVLLLLPALLLVAACSGSDTPDVQVAEVVRADVSEVVDAPGTVTARATSTVTAPADGTVAKLVARDGATVEKGEVLLLIDSPAAQARLEQTRSARAAASARVDLPSADLGPLQDQLDAAAQDAFHAAREAARSVPKGAARKALLARVETSEARYDAAAAAARSVAGSVGAGAASVEDALNAAGSSQRAQAAALEDTARAVVDALVVKAPQDGVVTYGATGGAGAPDAPGLDGLLSQLPPGLAQGALGDSTPAPDTSAALAVGVPVTSGSPLLTVTDVSGLGVVAEVDETDVLLVSKGVPAGIELDAVPGATYEGSVTAVDVAPTTSASGGVTYRVRLSLSRGTNADGDRSPRPRPGMSAVVELRVRSAEGAVSVPSAAVVRDGERDAVFVEAGGAYRRREVQLGAEGEDVVQVVSGLEVGERIVTRDADRLTDGQQVE